MPFCCQFPLPRQSANWHTFATAKTAKAAKPKHKNRPFSGAFPKNKMYLFIKFSTRTHIQLEMGLKLANFGPIPSQKNFSLKMVLKSPIILLKFSQKLHQNRQILGPNFAIFAIYFCQGKRQRV